MILRTLDTIKGRIFYIYIFSLMLFVGGIVANFYLSRQIEKMRALNNVLSQMEINSLELRRAEKDFLSRGVQDENFYKTGENDYISKQKKYYQGASDDLHFLLKSHFFIKKTAMSIKINQMIQLLNRYEYHFDALVKKHRLLGFKEYGLEGQMRNAVHAFEGEGGVEGELKYNIISHPLSDKLQAMQLMLRRNEKDFLLRSDKNYADLFFKNAGVMKMSLQTSTEKNKNEKMRLLNNYVTLFQKLVLLHEDIGLTENEGITGMMRDAFHTLERMDNQIRPSIKEALKHSLFILNLIFYGVMIVFFVCLVSVFAYLTSWLMKPILYLKKNIESVSKGNLDKVIYLKGNNEFSLLAESLETMRKNLKSSIETKQYMASHDELTGLNNRAQFEEFSKRIIAQSLRHKRICAMLFIDIDYFKKVNDVFGHHAGDLLLQAIAERLNTALRKEDFALRREDNNITSRLGGDEFTVLLTELASVDDTDIVAKRLLVALSKPYLLEDKHIEVTVSIGIACLPRDGKDYRTLIQQADMAMYRAKQGGRNQYQH